MKQNNPSDSTIEELIKRKKLLQSVLIAFTIIWLMILVLAIYFLISKSTYKLFLPLLPLPIILTPIFIQFGLINKELSLRKNNK